MTEETKDTSEISQGAQPSKKKAPKKREGKKRWLYMTFSPRDTSPEEIYTLMRNAIEEFKHQ